MMSLDLIKHLNQEVAEEAAQEGRTPFVYADSSEVDQLLPFPFPALGDHRPEGWELVESHFADSSGMGAPDEPALTPEQLIELIENRLAHAERGETLGWAIIESGQFQLYVGEFRKTS